MRYVLAVDGGNTKTIALVAALDGTILSAEYGACGDIYNAIPNENTSDPTTTALRNVEDTIMAALQAAQVSPAEIETSVFNMAGADWPEDISFWHDTMTEYGFGKHVVAQNDALGVLYLGSPDAVGVSIVCGTGAATGARAANGHIWHSSFWQDEAQGSAHLGQKTLFAVYRSTLGIEPPTSLTERLLAHFEVASVEDILHLFHDRHHAAPGSVDRLTPILLDEAEAGDALALQVVHEHGAALGTIAQVAARQVGLESREFPLVLSGGVFRHPTHVLEDAIVARMRETLPAVRPVRSAAEPIIGVLLQALNVAGMTMDQSLLNRMMPTIPAMLLAHNTDENASMLQALRYA